MSALNRVVRSPGLILWMVALYCIPAWILGSSVRSGVSSAMDGFVQPYGEQWLPAMAELLANQGGSLGFLNALVPPVLVLVLVIWLFSLGAVQPSNHSPEAE